MKYQVYIFIENPEKLIVLPTSKIIMVNNLEENDTFSCMFHLPHIPSFFNIYFLTQYFRESNMLFV